MSIKVSGEALPSNAKGADFSKDSVDWKSYKAANGIETKPVLETETETEGEETEKKEEEVVEEPEKKEEEEVVEEPEKKEEEEVKEEKESESTTTSSEEEIDLDELKKLRIQAKQYNALLPEFTKLTQRISQLEGKRSMTGASAPTNLTPTQRKSLDEVVKASLEKRGLSSDPNEVKELYEVFEEALKERGFVPKEVLEQEQYVKSSEGVLQDFLTAHPELDEKNDPNDVNWTVFKNEFDLYKQPNNPKALKSLMEKVYENVFGEKKRTLETETKIMAKIRRNKVATMGGGGSGNGRPTTKATTSTLTPAMVAIYKDSGLSDEEIKQLS